MATASYLRTLKALWIIGLVAVLLALFEHRQMETHGHLRDRSHPRGPVRLAARSLQELAGVLLARYPETAAPNLLMGTALVEQGKLQEARGYLEKAMAIDPRNQQLLFLYARLLVDLDEDPERVRSVVEDLGRYFPRSRDDIEAYFRGATRGRVRFDGEPY